MTGAHTLTFVGNFFLYRKLMEYEIEKIKHQSEHEQQLLKTRLSNVLQKQHDVQSEANRKVEQYEFEMNTLRKKIDVVCRRLLDVWGGLTLVVFLLVVLLLLWILSGNNLRQSNIAVEHVEKTSSSEVQTLKQALTEQRSQLELLSQSHVNLEEERNRVALELSELQIGQQQVKKAMERQQQQHLTESALMLETVQRGAKEFSSVLHGSSGSAGGRVYGGRSRGSTY